MINTKWGMTIVVLKGNVCGRCKFFKAWNLSRESKEEVLGHCAEGTVGDYNPHILWVWKSNGMLVVNARLLWLKNARPVPELGFLMSILEFFSPYHDESRMEKEREKKMCCGGGRKEKLHKNKTAEMWYFKEEVCPSYEWFLDFGVYFW